MPAYRTQNNYHHKVLLMKKLFYFMTVAGTRRKELSPVQIVQRLLPLIADENQRETRIREWEKSESKKSRLPLQEESFSVARHQ